MRRLFLASIAVVSAFALVPFAVKAQKAAPNNGALPKSNQIYVKIIVPTDSATGGKDRAVVESWIADQLKKRGQAKFTAATAWVPLAVTGEKSKMVWNGWLDDEQWGTVALKMTERADGRIKLLFDGFGPCRGKVTVSLTDEPGSRGIAAVEEAMTKQGPPYVAVLIGPPPDQLAVPTDDKK